MKKKIINLVLSSALLLGLCSCAVKQQQGRINERLTPEQRTEMRLQYPYIDPMVSMAGPYVEADLLTGASLTKYKNVILSVELKEDMETLSFDMAIDESGELIVQMENYYYLAEILDILAVNEIGDTEISVGDFIYLHFPLVDSLNLTPGTRLIVFGMSDNERVGKPMFSVSSASTFYITQSDYVLSMSKLEGVNKYSGYKYEDFKQMAIDFTKSIEWK
jgi:hypothetical protein